MCCRTIIQFYGMHSALFYFIMFLAVSECLQVVHGLAIKNLHPNMYLYVLLMLMQWQMHQQLVPALPASHVSHLLHGLHISLQRHELTVNRWYSVVQVLLLLRCASQFQIIVHDQMIIL